MGEKRTTKVVDFVTSWDKTVLTLKGDVVSIELHCGDLYMARVMFEDMSDRVKTGSVFIEFGKVDKNG